MVLVTMRPDRAGAKFDKPAVKIMFQVTEIVRFLLERGITKETAVLFDCVDRYEEKGRLGQVRALRFLVHAVGGA